MCRTTRPPSRGVHTHTHFIPKLIHRRKDCFGSSDFLYFVKKGNIYIFDFFFFLQLGLIPLHRRISGRIHRGIPVNEAVIVHVPGRGRTVTVKLPSETSLLFFLSCFRPSPVLKRPPLSERSTVVSPARASARRRTADAYPIERNIMISASSDSRIYQRVSG